MGCRVGLGRERAWTRVRRRERRVCGVLEGGMEWGEGRGGADLEVHCCWGCEGR